jgi:signal transduction histidine kinase
MPTIEADKELIRLLYQELVDNALHATRDVMLAQVEIGFADGAFYVKDNGAGFEQVYAHTLFDLFRRYDHGDEAVGAGLAVARRIVGMHKGTIWAEGESGRGATFRFTIGLPGVRAAGTAHTVVSHMAAP